MTFMAFQVPDELIDESSVRKAGNGLETSFSVLQLSSENRDYFPRSGAVTIACEAVIPTPSMPPEFQRDMAGISRTAEEERTQFNRCVASAAEAEQVVAARPKLHHRNAALVSNLILRKEIIVYGELQDSFSFKCDVNFLQRHLVAFKSFK